MMIVIRTVLNLSRHFAADEEEEEEKKTKRIRTTTHCFSPIVVKTELSKNKSCFSSESSR